MTWEQIALVGEVLLFVLGWQLIKGLMAYWSQKTMVAAAGNPLLNLEGLVDQLNRMNTEDE